MPFTEFLGWQGFLQRRGIEEWNRKQRQEWERATKGG
jgi:hypothetical protein